MDEDVAELKELLQKSIEISEGTNRVVHKMYRAQQWGRLFQIVWWILIIAVSGATYYLYLQPYVGKLEQLYEQVQGSQQAPSWNTQIENFLKNLAPKSTSSSTTQK